MTIYLYSIDDNYLFSPSLIADIPVFKFEIDQETKMVDIEKMIECVQSGNFKTN
jgi:hypothetical protein